ncbi:MAG: precorrin-8X methylmutase [Ignisphaera sp.]
MKVSIIVIAHGSSSIEVYRDLKNVIESMKMFIVEQDLEIHLAYNEKVGNVSVPHWEEVLEEVLERGVTNIVMVLLFIAKGKHVVRDIVGKFMDNLVFDQWMKVMWKGYIFNLYITSPISSTTLFKLMIANSINRSISMLKQKVLSVEKNVSRIETESLERINLLLNTIIETSDFEKMVMARVVFASGNLDLAYHTYIHPRFLDVAREVLTNQKIPVVTDVKMVYSGIRWREKYTFIDHEDTVKLAKEMNMARTAASMVVAASRYRIFIPIIGNSPLALSQVLEMVNKSLIEIPFAIATPPGFVNAVVVKERLIRSGIPCITVRGSYGGSSLAVAIFNGVVEYVKQM